MTREYQIEGIYVNETTDDEFQVETVYLNETQAAPTAAIMNQMQSANLGADLYNGTIVV